MELCNTKLIVEPGTLRVVFSYGIHEVLGQHENKLIQIALFHSEAAAKNFVTWSVTHSKSWAGYQVDPSDYSPRMLPDTSPESPKLEE